MNIAVVPVYAESVFEWLGVANSVDRLLDKLADVRELDEIRLVSVTGNVPCRVTGETRVRQIKTTTPIESMVRLCRIFHVGAKSEAIYLACNPTFPFLDRGRIESVLHSVLSGASEAALTVYGRWSVCACDGKYEIKDKASYVDACVAMRVPPGGPEMGKCAVLGGSIQEIEINAIEAVNIITPEGKRLAEALSLGFV